MGRAGVNPLFSVQSPVFSLQSSADTGFAEIDDWRLTLATAFVICDTQSGMLLVSGYHIDL